MLGVKTATLCLVSCWYAVATSVGAENLALGAKVQFVVPPNYHYSRDVNDDKHLVDGLPKGGTRSYLPWTNPGAVGWSYRMVAFVIDFGKPERVGCVVIRSKHCERVGVLPPHDVKVYGADDAETLQLIAQSGHGPAIAVPAVPKGEDAGLFRVVLNTVPLRTRRLVIVMRAVKNLSIDEVEVLPGSLSTGAAPGLSQAKAVPLEEAYAPLLGSRLDVAQVLRQAGVVAALKWGKLSAGPLRALFVLPAASVRDAAELAHRAEIQPAVVPFYYDGALDPVAGVKLKKALDGEPEVCIVGGLAWAGIPGQVQAAMLDAVRSRGIGILWVDSTGRNSIELPGDAAATPLVSEALSDMAASLSPKVWVKAYRLGAGRVAVLRMGGGTKVPPTTLLPIVRAETDMVGMPRWEACCVGLLRTALWAAGRGDSPLALRMQDAGIIVAHANPSADRLRVRWLDRYWNTLSDDVVKAGDSVAIPHLPRGANACAVAALDRDGRVLDLAMVGVPGREIARISRVAARPQPLDPASPGTATLTIESSQLRAVVNVQVYDPWSRLLCDRVSEVELREGRNEIEILLSGLNRSPRAVSLLIEAVVAAEGHVLDRTRLHVAVKQQRRPAFFFQEWSGMSWWGANSSAGLAMVAEEQRLGVDAATYYGVHDSTIRPRLAHNIRVNPLGFGRVHVKSAELRNPIRKPPLHDPEYVDKLTKEMLRQAEIAALCQPDCVISGDEQSIGWWGWPNDLDWSRLSLQRFRSWLKQRYANLAALNASWGTTFDAWDAATPMKFEDAKRSGNLARWVEFRRFMDSEFVGLFSKLSRRLREKHPHLRVGMSGMSGPAAFNGFDYRALMDECALAAIAYDGIQRELLRSWAGEDDSVSAWSGYDFDDSNERYDRFHPWYMLVHGCGGASYYTSWQYSYQPYRDGGMVSVNGFANAHGEWIAEEMAAIRSGFATLLRGAKREPADIGILFSMESLAVGTCRGWGDYVQSVYGVTQAFEDLGLQYDMLAPRDLTTGRLTRYRLIVLPSAYCLSTTQFRALNAAAQNGATVLADWGLGLMDEHAAPVKQPAAERLLWDMPRERVEWTPSVAVSPRRVGRGTWVLLDSALPRYAWFQLKGAAAETEQQVQAAQAALREAWRGKLRRIAADAGCRYGPSVAGPADVEKTVYRDGAATYVVLLRKYGQRGSVADGEAAEFSVAAPKGAPFAYASRAGRYLGKDAKAKVRLKPSQAAVLAFMPYRVAGVEVAVAGREDAGVRFRARVVAEGGARGRHVLDVRVIDPEGRRMSAVERTIVAPGGVAEISIPKALNDAPGRYRVVVRDVASGQAGEAAFSR